MKITAQVTKLEQATSACLMIGIHEEGKLSATAEKLNELLGHSISAVLKQSAFSGKLGQVLPLYRVRAEKSQLVFEQVLLVGCGKKDKLSSPAYRKMIHGAFKHLVSSKITRVICYLTDIAVEQHDAAWKAKQIVEAAHDGLYRFDLFKTKKEPEIHLKEVAIHLPDAKLQKNCEQAVQQGLAIANAMSFTKNLANLPSNICTPTFLAEQAKDLAKTHPGLKVKVLNEKEMHQLGMGALLAVSQGSAEEAKLITLEYHGGSKKQAPVAFVGKGITFDTGGNSLKSPENMVGMKYDMCGAATVLGVLKAVAELKLPLNVVGVIPAVENMPGGTGYKPEDILTSLSGQTIEVISTDAEGRLILADALTYCERFEPDTVIDIATLTGAVVIALGVHATGLLSNHDPLAQDLLKAGVTSNDRAWQLPLWDEYQEQIKSPFADISNSGGRPAGTITAGCFLSRFTKKFHWAHLDVAGTAANMMNSSERMATGRPVPMLVQYLLDRC